MYSLIFAGMARVRCGHSAGRAARPAVWCGRGLDVCGVGGMQVARNRCGAGVGQHPQLRGGGGSEFPTHAELCQRCDTLRRGDSAP